MALLVVFVTGNAAVIDTVLKRKTSLVPVDMRADSFAAFFGEEVIVSCYRVTDSSTFAHLIEHITDLGMSTASGVLLLTDDRLPDLVGSLGDIFSVNRFEPPSHGQNPANILTSILAKCLRTFRYFMKRFDDKKYHQILRLPLRNFVARETGDMRRVCHDMMNSDNFGQGLDKTLQLFRLRQQPKKASSYPYVYLVDDQKKHFRLGLEVHARADTICPPHNSLCVMGNKFRFGRTFDSTKHYNVSRDSGVRMSGEYPDCHNVRRASRDATHLNMFSNDFF